MNKIKIAIGILIVASICGIYSLYHIIIWVFDNSSTSKVVNNIKIISEEVINEDNTISINFNNLLQKNNEVVGWIKVKGTNIDYPVLKHSDNQYYLNHSFDNSYNGAGWIFMDYRNDYNVLDFNTIIYGHGRRDGSMFGSLINILDKEWKNDKDNLVISLTTLNNNYLFQIFSIYYLDTTDDYINIDYDDILLNTVINRSIYDFNIGVNTNDKILTLSTCYNNEKKLVVHSKMIKKEVKY